MNRIRTSDLADNWLFLKLYLGRAAINMDTFIVETIPKLITLGGYDRWFFIRYLDDLGAHVRLRFRLTRDYPKDKGYFAAAVRSMCHKGLVALAQYPPTDYRPMVLPPGFDPEIVPDAIVNIVEDKYEPEYDKFGGVLAMPIAEETFEASSEVALSVLKDESMGKYSRKTIAPCLMNFAIEAFEPLEETHLFWSEYSYFWLGGHTSTAEEWRKRFEIRYSQLQDQNIPIISPMTELPVEARKPLEQWLKQLRITTKAYNELESTSQVTSASLAFQFIHLMNNRIGISTFEEAYLATLLGLCTHGETS